MANESEQFSTAALKEIWVGGEEYDEAASLEAEMQKDINERGSDIDSLLRAKFKIINGDFKMAKFYLNRIDDKNSRLFAVKKRYQATIAFIEGKFNESLDYLKDKKFSNPPFYPQICLLKMINHMATNDTLALRIESKSCTYYTGKTSKNDQYWLDSMVKLKLQDNKGLKQNLRADADLSEDEMAKLWLKTGLYLNKEQDILKFLSYLPESSYQSKRLREIIAFMYLRSKTVEGRQKAMAFVDDIDTANAENIKGNINLQNKEYELAFGHFKLALQKKQDSMNSLERAIPLAWILGQWKDGLEMIDNNPNKALDPKNKSALRIAFLIRDKQFEEAAKELTILKNKFGQEPPLEINIMDSYVSLIMGEKEQKFDKRKIEESAEKACRFFDGMSCWIALQFSEWENIGKTIKRDELVFSDKEMTLDSLKEKKVITPLKETISVDQKDIEELDSQSIQLMKVVPK